MSCSGHVFVRKRLHSPTLMECVSAGCRSGACTVMVPVMGAMVVLCGIHVEAWYVGLGVSIEEGYVRDGGCVMGT